MRLLVVTHYFWPESFRINDLVADWVRRGHDVTVLAGPPSYPEGVVLPEYKRDPGRFSRYEGARIVRVPWIPRGKSRFGLAVNYVTAALSAGILGSWRLRGLPIDVIFVFQPSPFTTCMPAIAIGTIKRAPVVMWVLDLWPESLTSVGVVRKPWLLAPLGWIVSLCYQRCALVLAASRAFTEGIAKYLKDASRIRYFPGWAEPLFHGGVTLVDPAPEVRPYQDTFNVLFAGNVGHAQDFPAILDAAEELRARSDIRWLIVGNGRVAEWVEAEIRRRGLERSVIMLGRHPIERMPSFFRVAGALLVSLKTDPVFAKTVPGRVQAFLASGLPIVAMLDGEGARVIEEAGAGLVCPASDAKALAERVTQLVSLTPEERAAMGARGLAYVEREFNRDRLLTQLERWMIELAGSDRAARAR